MQHLPEAGPVRRTVATNRGDVTTITCRGCGGAMRFGIDDQHVVCHECGHGEAIVQTHDLAPLHRAPRNAVPLVSPSAEAPTAQPAREQSRRADDHLKEVTCPTCGGAEIFTGTLASTRCPFCATELQLSDVHDGPDSLRVDGIIPFVVTESEAREAIATWKAKQHLAHDSFSTDAVIDSLQTVYFGAYLYDLTCTTTYAGQRGDEHYNSEGESYINWERVSGNRRDTFGNAVVIATDRIAQHHSARLGPWPFRQIRDFDRGFLTGHLSHAVDQPPAHYVAQGLVAIDRQIARSIEMVIGGDRQRIERRETNVESAAHRHLLVPVWMSTLTHRGETHHLVVNGATGVVSGESPKDSAKVAIYGFLAFLIVVSFIALTILLVTKVGITDGVFQEPE